MTALIILVGSAALATLSVGLIRRIAIARRMIDVPNERSSHTIPTPRGGGLGIVLVTLAGTLILGLLNLVPPNIVGAMLVGGLVAGIGYLDDQGGLSPLQRAFIHFIAAIFGVILLGGMPQLDLGSTTLKWGWLGHLVAVVGTVWMINLYNFMDGIDGLAGSEAVFVFGIGGLLLINSGLGELALLCALLVGSCLGFLRWNWPPAKIFMGDVASGFLGYLIAIIAIASGSAGFSLWVWLILAGVFIVDSTVTLLRRVRHGEKWYEAHRSHAYQHLTQRWRSHRRVTATVLGINLLWLAPIAVALTIDAVWSPIGVAIGLLPMVLLAYLLDAGKETQKTL